MSDIMRRDGMRLDRLTARSLKEIEQAALLERVVQNRQEQNRAALVNQRIDNGYELTRLTAAQAMLLNQQITAIASGNVGLELGLRELEETTRRAAQAVIVNYMLR